MSLCGLIDFDFLASFFIRLLFAKNLKKKFCLRCDFFRGKKVFVQKKYAEMQLRLF